MKEKGKFIFYIEPIDENCDPINPKDADGWGVYINTKECWENNHNLNSSYTEEEFEILEPILTKLKLEEIQESVFTTEFKYYPTQTQLHDALVKEGLEYNEEFAEWIKDGHHDIC